ncbi:hypothetical protein G9A89_008917 [Geosiphon pyriformis]|nr:hypothetical protein G9A89_008917 [Geosiphon pyriformis]
MPQIENHKIYYKKPLNHELGEKKFSTDPIHNFKVPFPPKIVAKECITIKDGKLPSKAPNCFIIYRRAYQKEICERGHPYRLSLVSSMASGSWKYEPDEVKEVYRKLAKDATILLLNLRSKAVITGEKPVEKNKLEPFIKKMNNNKIDLYDEDAWSRKINELKTLDVETLNTSEKNSSLTGPYVSSFEQRYDYYGYLPEQTYQDRQFSVEIFSLNYDIEKEVNIDPEINSFEKRPITIPSIFGIS